MTTLCEDLIEGMKILTQDDYKNIEGISINDKLLSRFKLENILMP